jgi:hypothetical protein
MSKSFDVISFHDRIMRAFLRSRYQRGIYNWCEHVAPALSE